MTKADYLRVLETAIADWRRYGDIGSSVLVRDRVWFERYDPAKDMRMVTESAILVTFGADGVRFKR